jgi:hypothetical protein
MATDREEKQHQEEEIFSSPAEALAGASQASLSRDSTPSSRVVGWTVAADEA